MSDSVYWVSSKDVKEKIIGETPKVAVLTLVRKLRQRHFYGDIIEVKDSKETYWFDTDDIFEEIDKVVMRLAEE